MTGLARIAPLVQRSFAVGMPHILKRFGRDALGLPHATSLRMGPLGYQSDAQARIGASYNCLKSYAESLYDALTQPYPAYEKMGILYEGEYRQLSTSLLQIEKVYNLKGAKGAISIAYAPEEKLLFVVSQSI